MDVASLGPEWTQIIGLLLSTGELRAPRDDPNAVSTGWVRYLRFLRIARLARVLKLKKIFEAVADRTGSESFTIFLDILKLIFTVVLLSHILGCGYFMLGMSLYSAKLRGDPGAVELTWVEEWDSIFIQLRS